MLLDDLKLKNLHYEILTAMESTSRVEARRNAGYLYAIQHGARHIFDAYPETYTSAKIPLEVLYLTNKKEWWIVCWVFVKKMTLVFIFNRVFL